MSPDGFLEVFWRLVMLCFSVRLQSTFLSAFLGFYIDVGYLIGALLVTCSIIFQSLFWHACCIDFTYIFRCSEPVKSCSRSSGSTNSHFSKFLKNHEKHVRFRHGILTILVTFWYTILHIFSECFSNTFLDAFWSTLGRNVSWNRSGKTPLFRTFAEPWSSLHPDVDFLWFLDTF